MWDFFRKARDIRATEIQSNEPDFLALGRVNDLIDWVETHRHLAADGLSYDAASDFVANRYSLVTVYASYLRSVYQNDLGRLDGLTEQQAGFGEDPPHALYDLGPASFDRPAWSPNIDSMWSALKDAAELWRDGSGSQGLRNQEFLGSHWALPAWTDDPRFSDLMTSVDPAFAAKMAGDRVTRWGHVSKLILTPHLIAPGRAATFKNDEERIRGHAYMGLAPELLGTLDPSGTHPILGRLKFPVYEDQPVLAFPIGGTEDTLFLASNNSAFTGPIPNGAEAALYKWNEAPADYFFHVPHEKGSQILLSYELSDPPSLRVRALVSLGSTEITRPFRRYQDRFAPSRAFVEGQWQDVELDENRLFETRVQMLTVGFVPPR